MAPLARSLRSKDYTVAWISAIQKEYLIACALLDDEHDNPIDIGNDDNCYTFGSIGEHNVVVASLPMARMGLTQAGMLATEMLRTFPKLRFGLMTGIAGAAPSSNNDIRLGDVVVSVPDDHTRLGGVVHYGFGATDQRKGFQRRGNLNAPPEVLLNATNKLKTKFDRQGNRLDHMIHQVIDHNSPRLDQYKRPPKESDILYNSTFIHPEGASCCADVCAKQDEAVKERLPRPSHVDQPVIHYGTIGSADNLMKDASLRDHLASKDGILCFEMESAGLMNTDLRCIVIRGICDYSDTHKNDLWQDYAAAAAAMYAKELLGVVRALKTFRVGTYGVTKLLTGKKNDVLDTLKYEGMFDKREYSMPEAMYYNDWIWETDFPKWLSTSDRPYWINGKPGSGKSTLMAYLAVSKQTMAHLRLRDENYWTGHFYFDYRAGKNLPNNITGLYRTLLHQLADQNAQIKERLTTLLEGGRLRVDNQQNLLDAICEAQILSGYKFCLFLDGLDEFEGGVIEVVHMCQLIKQRIPVKFCLASRPDSQLPNTLNLWSQITMQEFNEASMLLYIERKVQKASATNYTIERRFHPTLTKYLIRRAEGILLWFKLVVDMVVEQFDQGASNSDIVDLVQDVPDTLDEVYHRILEMIPQRDRPEASLLLFLTGRLQSMSKWTEEGIAVSMDFSTTNLDHFWGAYDFILDDVGRELATFRLESHEELQARTRQLLQGLIEFSPSKGGATMIDLLGETGLSVRYVHETFSAFINKERWIDRYLPEIIKTRYSSSFWLGFCGRLIKQASVDRMIEPKIMDQARNELNMWLEAWSFGDLRMEDAPKKIVRWFSHHAFRPYSVVKALHSEFCPLLRSTEYSDPIILALEGIIVAGAPNVEFPPAWKRRHVIIRTAVFLLLDLAVIHEDTGESSYPIISKAMQCHLNPILAYCIFMSGRESVDRKLLTKIQSDSKLMPAMDAYLAVKTGLEYYFRDRLADSTLSEYQQDFLFKAVLSHPAANQVISLKAIKGFLESLANYGRFPLQSDICFLMRNTKCWQTASDLSVALMNHVSPELPHNSMWQPCCKVSNRQVGLLFHWAQVTCAPSCRCAHAAIRPTADYSMVLQLMMAHGADLHAKCYWGGTVFQALLDSSIERRDDHGPLDRKAKFLALTENGFDPTVLAENGHDALQSAISAFNNGKAKSMYEIDSIIGYLRFYDIYAKWPEEEYETLDLVQSAIRWPSEADRVQRNSLQSTQGSTQGSERQPEQHAVHESNDLYGDDYEADTPEAPHSPESAPTVRRRRAQPVEIADAEARSSDEEPDNPLPRPLSKDFQKNVSKMADAVEDILKVRAAEATVTMNKWKTSLASNWKKLDLGSVNRPKVPADE